MKSISNRVSVCVCVCVNMGNPKLTSTFPGTIPTSHHNVPGPILGHYTRNRCIRSCLWICWAVLGVVDNLPPLREFECVRGACFPWSLWLVGHRFRFSDTGFKLLFCLQFRFIASIYTMYIRMCVYIYMLTCIVWYAPTAWDHTYIHTYIHTYMCAYYIVGIHIYRWSYAI